MVGVLGTELVKVVLDPPKRRSAHAIERGIAAIQEAQGTAEGAGLGVCLRVVSAFRHGERVVDDDGDIKGGGGDEAGGLDGGAGEEEHDGEEDGDAEEHEEEVVDAEVVDEEGK